MTDKLTLYASHYVKLECMKVRLEVFSNDSESGESTLLLKPRRESITNYHYTF